MTTPESIAGGVGLAFSCDGVDAELNLRETLAFLLRASSRVILWDAHQTLPSLLGAPTRYCTTQRLPSPRKRMPNPGRVSSHSMWSALPAGWASRRDCISSEFHGPLVVTCCCGKQMGSMSASSSHLLP